MTDTPDACGPELIFRPAVSNDLTDAQKTWIARCATRIFDVLGCPEQSEACIVFTDDAEIQELNGTWRHVDAATDVLSFAYQEAEDGFILPHLLGDIVISIPTARRYANEAQHASWISASDVPRAPWTFEFEIAFLIGHGFLHVLGFDHIEEADERIMRPLEREVFEALVADTAPPRRSQPLRPHTVL